jgi:uncharacterized membrane protein
LVFDVDQRHHAQCLRQAMLNPLKWERVDQVRLLLAAAFGALLGFTTGSGQVWFNLVGALVGAILVGGWFYYYRAFR